MTCPMTVVQLTPNLAAMSRMRSPARYAVRSWSTSAGLRRRWVWRAGPAGEGFECCPFSSRRPVSCSRAVGSGPCSGRSRRFRSARDLCPGRVSSLAEGFESCPFRSTRCRNDNDVVRGPERSTSALVGAPVDSGSSVDPFPSDECLKLQRRSLEQARFGSRTGRHRRLAGQAQGPERSGWRRADDRS